MRLTLLTIVLSFLTFVYPSTAKATVEVFEHFQHQHLNLSFGFNHSESVDTDVLYYKGVAEVLNAYIDQQIAQGKLIDKTFEIKVGSGIFGGIPEINLSQNSNGYFVRIHGYSNLNFLLRLVDYFAHSDYTSFIYRWKTEDENIWYSEQFKLTLNRTVPNVPSFEYNPIEVFRTNELSVNFEKGELAVYHYGKLLPIQLADPLPVSKNGLYFIASSTSVLCYEEQVEVARTEFKGISGDFSQMRLHKNWMNLYLYDQTISYCISEQKFYRLVEK